MTYIKKTGSYRSRFFNACFSSLPEYQKEANHNKKVYKFAAGTCSIKLKNEPALKIKKPQKGLFYYWLGNKDYSGLPALHPFGAISKKR